MCATLFVAEAACRLVIAVSILKFGNNVLLLVKSGST